MRSLSTLKSVLTNPNEAWRNAFQRVKTRNMPHMLTRRYLRSDCYNPSKKRSSKQQAHLAQINSKKPLDKKNIPDDCYTFPTPSRAEALVHNQLTVQQQRAITYEKHYRCERKWSTRKELTVVSISKIPGSLFGFAPLNQLAFSAQLAKEQIRHNKLQIWFFPQGTTRR